jgi:zinc transporter 2
MNIRAALIHVIGDIIQSVGVLIAAIILYFYPTYWIIDPCCTFLFSILVLFTTIPIMKDCIKVFMEATPSSINIDRLIKDLSNVIFFQ